MSHKARPVRAGGRGAMARSDRLINMMHGRFANSGLNSLSLNDLTPNRRGLYWHLPAGSRAGER